MATSGSTNFSITRNEIIERALRILGVTPQGQLPNATQYSDGAKALNGLVKALEADGLPLWGRTNYSLTLVAGTRVYSIGEGQTVNTPKPLKMERIFRRHISSNTDTPINMVTKQEYDALSNKFITGIPYQFYYEPKRIYGDLYVHPVPDATTASSYTLEMVYQRPFEDFDTSTDEPDFPQEWFDALCFLLADRMALEYGLAREVRDTIKGKALELKNEALGFGTEEGSIYFQFNRQ